ncbi:MAG: hypothetical protein AMXMBFR46_00040 [Acidimicrobiia bacterium]
MSEQSWCAPLAPWVARLEGLSDVDEPVVVACSGGPDSLALLALATAAGLTPVAAYVDHGLRGEAAGEAALVARVACRWGLPARSVRTSVDPGPNLEARARAARYDALDAVRQEVGANAVLVGHTADDQAETVVLNLLRGSASAGLGAMAVRRGWVVRPILGLRRADCEAICAVAGVEPVRDPMNADLGLRRVRVRHEVLPTLGAAAGRDLVPVLARQAVVLRSESDYLDELARGAWPPAPPVPVPEAGTAPAPAAALGDLPVVLARRAVRLWVGSPPPSFAEVERVLAVARGDIRGTQLAGGRSVRRRDGVLHLDRASVDG